MNEVKLTCAGCARFNRCRQPRRGPDYPACGDYQPALHAFAHGENAPAELFEVLGLLAAAQRTLNENPKVPRRDNTWQYIAAVCSQAAAANQRLANTPFQVFNYYWVQYRGMDVDYLSNWARMLLVGVTYVPAVGKSHAGYALEFVALDSAPVIRSVRMVWHPPGVSNKFFMRFPIMPERILNEAEWELYKAELVEESRFIDPAIEANAEALSRKIRSEMLAAADGNKAMPDTAARFLASVGEFDPGSALDYPPDTSPDAYQLDDVGELVPESRDITQFPVVDLPDSQYVQNALLSIFPASFFLSSTGEEAKPVYGSGGDIVSVDVCGMFVVPPSECHIDIEHGVVVGGTWEQKTYDPDSYIFAPSEVLEGGVMSWVESAKLPDNVKKVLVALASEAESQLPPSDIDSLRDEVSRGGR